MLPFLPNQMLSQNKISGQQIAYGSATWGNVDGDTEGYVFPDGSLVLSQSLNHLEAEGIGMESLLDCVEQFEEAYGSPEDLRLKLGLLKDFGETSPGLVIRSRLDPRIKCIVTPASWEVLRTEAYFQWFLDSDTANSLSNYDELAGIDTSPDPIRPMEVPWYEEACHKVSGLTHVSEARKSAFLQSVWDYHKNLMPGYKAEARSKICREYRSLIESNDEKVFTYNGIKFAVYSEPAEDYVGGKFVKNTSKPPIFNWYLKNGPKLDGHAKSEKDAEIKAKEAIDAVLQRRNGR